MTGSTDAVADRLPEARERLFHLVMIKPSHYDDDGYPIQWVRSAIPSNTLACLNGLAEDARARKVLGPDVEIRLHTYDETNRRVRPDRIVKGITKSGGRALIALGRRSIQSVPPRRRSGRAVSGGRPAGLHRRLPRLRLHRHAAGNAADIREAQARGHIVVCRRGRRRTFDKVLRDAWNGKLAPLYNFMDKLPSLRGEPPPILPGKHVRRTSGSLSSIDLGRGCPYQCSFCTIINVQGRKSRFRSPDDLERTVRENYAQNIKRFFITDDNFARNADWEVLFDRLIALRAGECPKIGFTIQVDTLCHKIPNFIEKAAQAGVRRVFIGLENINPDNLIAAKKRQNKITDYREMLQKWRDHGAITCAGYIIGFPGDTKASVLRDIEIIKRELPLDILELFFLTPLPGSEDHKSSGRPGLDGPGHEQVRPQPPRGASCQNVGRGMGGCLSFGLAGVLYDRSIRTILRRAAASRLGRPRHDAFDACCGSSSSVSSRAFTRSKAAYCGANSAATAGRNAPRKSADVLSALCRRNGRQALAIPVDLPAVQVHPRRGRGRAGPLDLHRPRRSPRPRTTNSRRSISTSDSRLRRRAGAQTTQR